MKAKILSFNIGHPEPMEWNGKSVVSSMHKTAVPGPIVVHRDHIEGNSFASPEFHGHLDAVLYAYGLKSAREFVLRLGLADYIPGATGETITLDELDEKEVSVGDVFAFGAALAQATSPRIPCGKVNYRMQHPQGQKAMQDCERSGIYFRILQPSTIQRHDKVERVELAKHRFPIHLAYRKILRKEPVTQQDLALAQANGAFPANQIERWASEIRRA